MEPFIERINKNLQPFLYLWRTSDPDWVKQRSEDWENLKMAYFWNCSALETKECESYFKTGLATGAMNCNMKYLLTPLINTETARSYLLSKAMGPTAAGAVLLQFYEVTQEAMALPWWNDHNNYLLEIMGREYQILQALTRDGSLATYSPEPSFFCSGFYARSCQVFTKEKSSVTGVPLTTFQFINSLDYFCSALKQAVRQSQRMSMDMDKLFELAWKSQTKRGLTDQVREFGSALLEREAEIRDNWSINSHLDG